ncbi:Probable magnesium transporter NIPA9 [Linum perenne]
MKITMEKYLKEMKILQSKQNRLPGQLPERETAPPKVICRNTQWKSTLGAEMWESIILTLAATAGNNIGKVLQKKGTIILPPLSFKLKAVIRAYALNKAWVIGFLMDIGGAMLMLKAISQAPVSVIQPVSGCGLAVLSVFSHFYLKEVMNVIDWVGITLAAIGTIGVGAGGEEQESSPVSVFQLPWLAVVVALLFVGRAKWMASGLQAAAKRTRYHGI